MRNRFDKQLKQLNEELIKMGSLCEDVITFSVSALKSGNRSDTLKVEEIDSEIDQMERDIEAFCLKMLLQQQPIATDLRQISAALKMITDMERIGDQAKDIAEIMRFFRGNSDAECDDIHLMAKATIKMVTDSIDAYVNKDLDLAKSVIRFDDTVDNYFIKVKHSLINMISHNIANGEYAIDLLMIAKYFERIGDHATNIAEWVIFSITGIHKKEKAALE